MFGYYLIVTVILLGLFFIYLKRVSKYASLMEGYPQKINSTGLRPLPLIGIAHYFIGSNERLMKSLQLIGRDAIENGGAIAGWMGHIPYLAIADAELGELLLKTCLDKDDIMKLLNSVLGDGLVVAPMSVWRHRRRILVPTFSTKSLREFLRVFNKKAEVMVEQLKPKIGGEAFPIWKYLANNNMDVLSETVFGMELHSQTDVDTPFTHAFSQIGKILASRMGQPWLHSEYVFQLLPIYRSFKKYLDTLNTIVNTVIETKRKEIAERRNDKTEIKQKQVTPFLELLLQSSLLENGTAKGAYNDKELREETMTLAVAGTDTTAAGLAFAVLCLSKYQDIQDKVYKEIVDVFGDLHSPVEPDDEKKLIYMEAVIKEALRLFPPAPVFLRRAHEDITLPSEVVIPEGCSIMMNAWGLHRNPKYWGNDAEEFKPERFLVPMKHPAQYMAFGYGSRNCPGNRYAMLSIKTVLTILLRRYRLLPNKEGDSPVRVTFAVFMKDADLYQIRLENRNTARTEG